MTKRGRKSLPKSIRTVSVSVKLRPAEVAWARSEARRRDVTLTEVLIGGFRKAYRSANPKKPNQTA